MTIRIDPYKRYSGGAKALSKHTGILRATPKQVERHGTFDTIINWGNSERRFTNATYINNPEAVAIASSKLSTARCFCAEGIPQPAYTTEQNVADEWVNRGRTVLCRTLTRSSSGRGIVIVNTSWEEGPDNGRDGSDVTSPSNDRGAGRGGIRRGRVLVNAPLYTRYVKKADEYRVHVFDGEVIDVQKKRKRQEVPNEEVDYQIRNHNTGWVFCREGVECPSIVLQSSIRAVSVLDLDFGAVDVGYNVEGGSCFVYEVNTAPGIEGSTLDSYYNAILKRLPQISGGAYRRRRRA